MSTTSTDERYLQIGEAAERTALTQRTLRYYEEKGLLRAPSRMEGGFRLYSQEDLERVERIKELRDLLGFSLADIKEMLEADDVKMQLRAEWRKDADSAEKVAKIRVAREATLQQLALLDEKMSRMTAMRDQLAERMAKYDQWLLQWTEAEASAPAAG
jgi:MerR family transcriptional regulator, repressor of the yfmOP operon